jgi:3-hydroxy-9,10-secoandrosta-1,3,5(10)-triene-9,17-dione monooxygenase
MCGTGSNDVVIDRVHVPNERTVSLIELSQGTAPGSRLHSAPLYRTPMVPILTLAASMPALGQAKAVLRGYRERLAIRPQHMNPKKHAEKHAAQIRLGELDLILCQAELLLRDVIREVMEARDTADTTQRTRWMASFAHIVHQSRDVVQAVALASGGSAHKRTDPLQRALRDLNTLCAHVVFTKDDALQNYGRAQLGLELSGGML